MGLCVQPFSRKIYQLLKDVHTEVIQKQVLVAFETPSPMMLSPYLCVHYFYVFFYIFVHFWFYVDFYVYFYLLVFEQWSLGYRRKLILMSFNFPDVVWRKKACSKKLGIESFINRSKFIYLQQMLKRIFFFFSNYYDFMSSHLRLTQGSHSSSTTDKVEDSHLKL